jgi:hypothetical protein
MRLRTSPRDGVLSCSLLLLACVLLEGVQILHLHSPTASGLVPQKLLAKLCLPSAITSKDLGDSLPPKTPDVQ